MPLYTRFEDVRLRLAQKVRFVEDGSEDENAMPIALARRLINEAESQVEFDLSIRYATPFQTVDGQPFVSLPERPTKEYIRTLTELQSVIRILETDFGRGTAVDGDNYSKELKSRYKYMMARAVGQKSTETLRDFALPPLPGLRLGDYNASADDGYIGRPINTSEYGGVGRGMVDQINDPLVSWWSVGEKDVDGWPT